MSHIAKRLLDTNLKHLNLIRLKQLVDQQSIESEKEKRKHLVWDIERRLTDDGPRPVIFYPRSATCRHPQVKGLTVLVNSIYNGSRFEDLWVDD